jgi:hypothetical protein
MPPIITKVMKVPISSQPSKNSSFSSSCPEEVFRAITIPVISLEASSHLTLVTSLSNLSKNKNGIIDTNPRISPKKIALNLPSFLLIVGTKKRVAKAVIAVNEKMFPYTSLIEGDVESER